MWKNTKAGEVKSVKSGKAEFSEKVNPKEAKERVKLANGPPKPKGIPEGAVQGLVCEACMKKYSKISQTTTTTTTQKVTGFVQMTSGARIPGKETTVETTETKSEVKPFRRCMKCFPETAKELPKSENHIAYLCKKCNVGNARFSCIKCSKPLGGYAGSAAARLCERHANPQRCFRCGT